MDSFADSAVCMFFTSSIIFRPFALSWQILSCINDLNFVHELEHYLHLVKPSASRVNKMNCEIGFLIDKDLSKFLAHPLFPSR